jgi:hypothetical protein
MTKLTVLLVADNFGRAGGKHCLEHAQLYAYCRDVENYFPSRKHCLRTQRTVLYT